MRTNKTFISSQKYKEIIFLLELSSQPNLFFQKKEILSAKSFLLHFPLCFKYQLYSDPNVALLSQCYHFERAFALNFRALKYTCTQLSAQYFTQVTQGLGKKATCISSVASLIKMSLL